MVSARPVRGHWLEDQMSECEASVIEEVLTWDPPSNQQLVVLGLEEMKGRNRKEIYLLLAQFKRP